ncbi:cell division protein FtsL [Aliihoeflea sp. PC F10.4]
MFRTTDIVLIVVMVSAAAFTYKTKHDAENHLAEARRLQSQITFERDSIDVLHADWSLLTQPSRLQKLTDNFRDELKLYPVQPWQFATVSELTRRPLAIEDLIAGDGLIDETATGSIMQ